MNDRPILVETEHLEDASRIARYIFRQAVAYTANVMGVPIYNSDDMGSVRFVYNKYPELVLGFMQTSQHFTQTSRSRVQWRYERN